MREHGALITFGLLAAAALVLVPSPLIELRYLTLPALLLRAHAPLQAGVRTWAPTATAFVVINAAMFATFLLRPYIWGDGTTARFMW